MSRANRKAKRKLSGASPPKRKVKGGKNSEADCLVCDEPILEPGEHCEGDEAVFCEGNCQGWLHRKCAGLTRPAFDTLGEQDQYLCSYCMMVSQSKEISNLTDTIKNLHTAITSLTESITSLQSSVTKQSQSTAHKEATSNETPMTKAADDRNMNIVVYGVEESPPATSKSDRTRNDLNSVLPILSAVDPSIQNASINDLYRLGRYDSEQSRPRPILVKFLRRIDVTTILSNRNKVKKPIIIKADMSKDERKVESVLLQERWKLIQKGTNRKHISIRKKEIFVGKLLHAKVVDQKLVQCRCQTGTTDTVSSPSNSVEAEMDQDTP